MSELLDMRWRTGRKVGRTIYAQLGPEPSDMDPLIGVMDTGDLADSAVEGHNQCLDGYEAWMGAVGGRLAADL